MPRDHFELIGDAVANFLPSTLRSFTTNISSRNLKLWYGEDDAEHYEVQILGPTSRPRGLEIGFHAEHREPSKNDEILGRLSKREKTWRRALGPDAEAGKFLGSQSPWRRLSEVWKGAGLLSEEAGIEAAERLAQYVRSLEPLRVAKK
ncbi:MAG: hypothetical protein ABR548_13000 [Actinomycetota bacterium]|nr:hypothetical protein [Actinomycetota bacterium]